MKFSIYLFVISLLISSLQLNAQNRRDTYNRLGLQGGVTYGGLTTKNFNTTSKLGYFGGFTTRANYYNNLIILYGVNFFEFNTGMKVMQNMTSESQEIDFKASGVQLNLFIGQKLIGEHLSIEVGPILQINSKLKTDEQYQDYYMEGYAIKASDLEDITKINLNVAAMISTGFKSVKFWGQYQYGLTNTFGNLDEESIKNKDSRITNLNAHLGLASAGVVFYF